MNQKQKANREWKKKAGLRGMLVQDQDPAHLTPFLKESLNAYRRVRTLYIEFDALAFAREEGIPRTILWNNDSAEWKVTDPV